MGNFADIELKQRTDYWSSFFRRTSIDIPIKDGRGARLVLSTIFLSHNSYEEEVLLDWLKQNDYYIVIDDGTTKKRYKYVSWELSEKTSKKSNRVNVLEITVLDEESNKQIFSLRGAGSSLIGSGKAYLYTFNFSFDKQKKHFDDILFSGKRSNTTLMDDGTFKSFQKLNF